MVDKARVKEVREEEGQWAALKFALAGGKEELTEDFEQLEDDVDDVKAQMKGGTIDQVTCHACTGELDSQDVSRCPHCGYDASSHTKWRWIHAAFAGLLCATLIGIPVAILPILKARKYGSKAKRGVANVHRS